MKAAIQVRLEPPQLTRLQSISETTGQSLAAIIRYCIDKQLPNLETRFSTRTEVPLTVNQGNEKLISDGRH